MATITNTVRFASNIDELKRNLLDGINTIDVLKKSVDRAAESLGGAGLFRAANTTTAAIQQLGGVTRLTAAEIDQANAKIDRAIEKYQQMGIAAPTAMRDLSTSLKESAAHTSALSHHLNELKPSTDNAAAAFTSLKGTLTELWENPTAAVQKLAGALVSDMAPGLGAAGVAAGLTGAALAVVGVVAWEFAEKAAKIGANLNDMSEKTGIGVEALSRLAYAAPVAGTTIENLSNIVFMMQKNMAESPDKFERGLERIGLNFETFKKLAPEDQLMALSNALKATEDPVERNAAGFEMMGRQFRDAAPALYKLTEAMEMTKDLAPWSEEEAKQAEAFEMHLASIHLHIENIGTTLGRLVLPAFESLVSKLDEAAHWTPGHWLQVLLTYGGGPIGYINAKASAITAGYVGAAATMASPEGYLSGLGGMVGKTGVGGLNLPTSPKDPYSQDVGATEKEIDQILKGKLKAAEADRIVGATSVEMDKLREEAIKKTTKALDAQAEAAKKTAEFWREYNAVGANAYDTVMQMAGAEVEGIANDLRRGLSVDMVAKAWGVYKEQVVAVQKTEAEFAQAQKDLYDAMAANEALTVKAAGSIVTFAMHYDEAGKLVKGVGDVIRHLAFEIDGTTSSQLTAIDRNKLYAASLKQVEDGLRAVGSNLMQAPNVRPSGMVDDAFRNPPKMARELDTVRLAIDGIADAFQRMGVSSNSGLGQAIGGMQQFYGVIAQQNAHVKKMEQDYGVGSPQANAASGMRTRAGISSGIGIAADLVAQNVNTGAGASTGALIGVTALQGAAMGAVIGAPYAGVTFGLSIAAGAAAGAIAGWIQSGKEWRKVVNDIGRDFAGIHVSEEFADMIEKLEDDNGLGRAQAITTQLDKLIEMAGGLGGANFAFFFDKLHDAFSYLEQGGLATVQVTQILDKNFAQFAAAGTDAYGRINDSIRELIVLDQRFGTESKAIATFLQQQGQDAITGFTAIVDGTSDAIRGYEALKKAVDDATASGNQSDLTAALTAQHAGGMKAGPELADLGIQAVASYTASVASGTSPAEALKAMGPALAALDASYKALGLDITDVALKNLLLLNRVATANPTLLASVAGLSKEMIALDNMGLLTAGTFGAMERTGVQLYTRLQAAAAAAGGTTKDALGPMQAYLHQAAIEAKALGVPLDENTQMLIDQSKELGIWKEAGKSAMGLVTDAVMSLVDKVAELVAQLKGIPYVPDPKPKTGGDGTGDAGDGFLAGDDIGPDGLPLPKWPVPKKMAEGGFGYASGPTLFSTRGNEEYAFSGEGSRFSRGGTTSSADPAPSGDTHNHFTIHATDAQSFVRLLDRHAEAVAGATIKAVRYNKGSAETQLRGALRIS